MNSKNIFLAVVLSLACCICYCKLTDFKYLGCYKDNQGGRDIPAMKAYGIVRLGEAAMGPPIYETMYSPQMVPQLCSIACGLGGFKYAGLQSEKWCFCGNRYGSQGRANETECNWPCNGNSSIMCGGGFRNSVFELVYADTDAFLLGNRTYVKVNETAVIPFRSTPARGLIACIYMCDSPNCQAVIYSRQLGVCHFLEYQVVPPSLSGIADGEFFVRG